MHETRCPAPDCGRASERKQNTKVMYAGVAKTHIVGSPLGRLPRNKTLPRRGLVVGLRRKGLGESTIRSAYTILRAVLDAAVRDGALGINPSAAIRRPKVTHREAHYLTPDQVADLLQAAEAGRYTSLFALLVHTGLRRGEALALRWTDVDLDGDALRVRWTLTRTSKGLQPGEPKTEKSRRVVPLPRSAVEVLRAHQMRQAAERVAANEVWRDSGLVFTSEIGTPLEPRNVLRRFELLAGRAGLRGVHLHTRRHSTASFLLAAGTHTKVVQEHLGHSSYAITADIYSHVAPEQKREAADRLDAALQW
jgi:integrase